MHWIAPSEKDTDNAALGKRLWDATNQFRANSGLKSQEYSAPVPALRRSSRRRSRKRSDRTMKAAIQNLRQTRDLLLLRLLSGQVNLVEN
jgi:hypothetical protein